MGLFLFCTFLFIALAIFACSACHSSGTLFFILTHIHTHTRALTHAHTRAPARTHMSVHTDRKYVTQTNKHTDTCPTPSLVNDPARVPVFPYPFFQIFPINESAEDTPFLYNSNQGEQDKGTITFNANQRLFGLSVAGKPGSQGLLKITILAGTDSQDSPLRLDIPIKLSPCQFGFQPWRKTRQNFTSKVR